MASTYRHLRYLSASALVLFGLMPEAQGQTDTLLQPQPDTSATNRPQLPVFTLTTDDLDGELGNQDISGILQSSRDPFTAVAGFNFGQARFRIRGYDNGPRGPAPLLGGESFEILAESLGFEPDRIADLMASGALS